MRYFIVYVIMVLFAISSFGVLADSNNLEIRILDAIYNCKARGTVELNLAKAYYQPGELLTGTLEVWNKDQKPSLMAYDMSLHYKGIKWWSLSSTKQIPVGLDKVNLYLLSKASQVTVPFDAPDGKWSVNVNVNIDNCLWQLEKDLEVFECDNRVMDGDEDGIDCGGSCPLECKKVARYPGQVAYHTGYYKTSSSGRWSPIEIDAFGPVFMGGAWYDGGNINMNIPRGTYATAAYGCCCMECDASNFAFDCKYLATPRYNIDRYNIWSCGWNIFY